MSGAVRAGALDPNRAALYAGQTSVSEKQRMALWYQGVAVRDTMQDLYNWGSWETGFITHSGSEYVQLADYTIIQSLAKGVKKVE